MMQDGNVWEKAGVNVSVVYGSMPPEAYRRVHKAEGWLTLACLLNLCFGIMQQKRG